MSKRSKRIAFSLWGLALLALLGAGWAYIARPQIRDTVTDQLGRGDYQLVTTQGTVFSEDSLKEGPSGVFFGFANCPEVCPTTLGDIATWQEALADRGEQMTFYFITVDPARDDISMLNDYLSWAPGVVGVSGSEEEIAKAIRAFRIYARRVPLGKGEYTMDHSAQVLLFDEKGNLFEPIGYGEDPDRVMAKLDRLLQNR